MFSTIGVKVQIEAGRGTLGPDLGGCHMKGVSPGSPPRFQSKSSQNAVSLCQLEAHLLAFQDRAQGKAGTERIRKPLGNLQGPDGILLSRQ